MMHWNPRFEASRHVAQAFGINVADGGPLQTCGEHLLSWKNRTLSRPSETICELCAMDAFVISMLDDPKSLEVRYIAVPCSTWN